MMSKDRQRGIEEIIQAAIQKGEFKNLPGEGQPLKLDPNAFSQDEWQLAHHLLKENGFAPEFIEIRQSIEADLEAARADLRRACRWRKQAREKGESEDWVRSEFQRAQSQFRERITDLNHRIRDYNLIIPAQAFHRSPLNAPGEQQKIEDSSQS